MTAAPMNTSAREWDAKTYDRVSDPQFNWGVEVLERLELKGDEHAIDAGAGSGRVTELLVERLPRGRVLALDGSQSMVDQARERLGDRADYAVMDLAELEIEDPVDLVFSTATFHWVLDHQNLFNRIHAALKPGGRLHAQCGGQGNIAEHAEAIATVGQRPDFKEHFKEMPVLWNFSGGEQTEEELRKAGFSEARAWLEPKPVTPEDPKAFIQTVTLGPVLANLPEELRDPFTDAVLELMDDPPTLDYVRLNIEATR
jgi:trans-aconitate 2-methyltransferase